MLLSTCGCPCHSFHSRIKRRLPGIWDSNFVFFLLSFPSPPHPPPLLFSPLFLPQGLSHLMMSEQGRCSVLWCCSGLNCLPSCLWLVAQSLIIPGRPFAACLSYHGPGWQQGHPVAGGAFPSASWFPAPITPLASPLCTIICHPGPWLCRAASKREA